MRLLGWLNWSGHVLLGLGLCGPCMTVTPRLDSIEGLAKWLGLVDAPRTYSILTGTFELISGGNVVIGIALLLFSVVNPIAKLVVLRACLADARTGRPLGRAHRFATGFAKYSMVDVFVIALVVVASKSFPGGTTVDVRWGAYAFGAAALVSVVVSHGVAKRVQSGGGGA